MSLRDAAREQSGIAESAKAEALLQRALALNPALAEAHLQLGTLYSSQQNHSAAAGAYQRAIDLNPSLSLAHYRLGRALVLLGDPQQGKRHLDIWSELRSHEQEESEKARAELFQFVYSKTQP